MIFDKLADKEMHRALDRIARTEDGRLLYLLFQKTLCATSPVTAPDSALPRLEGRRQFASDLMGLMAKGIEESAGRDHHRRPVVFAAREPGSGGKHVTARDYLAAQPSEPAG